MTIQRLQRFLAFIPGQPTVYRSVPSLLLLALLVMGLPAPSGAQQACRPDGDVDRNGSVTAADALLAFQQALRLVQLDACQLTIADVFPQPAAPDGNITASDALCIFQKALRLPSCLPDAPPPNQPPVANAGFDQIVDENTVVTLSGSGSDADGTIARYAWVQTSGTAVGLSGADSQNANFTAPEVGADVDLVFQLTVTDDGGADSAPDTVTITVFDTAGLDASLTAHAGTDQTVYEATQVVLSGSGVDPDGAVLQFNWTQSSGPTVTLFGADTQTALFTAPEVEADGEAMVFQLTVTNDQGTSATGTVTITVADFVPPSDEAVAEALEALEASGAIPVLDRSVSIEGPDTDSDGVRDDVENYIESLPDTDAQKASLRQVSHAYTEAMRMGMGRPDTANLERMTEMIANAVNCIWETYGSDAAAGKVQDMTKIMVNTPERFDAYVQFDNLLGGFAITIPEGDTCETP